MKHDTAALAFSAGISASLHTRSAHGEADFLAPALALAAARKRRASESVADDSEPILTRFGDTVDVRRRGALRMGRFAGTQARAVDAPAVVRLWNDKQCRELSPHQARMLAEQLLAAARLADSQNQH